MPKKPFDKKKSVTFVLSERSQLDPLRFDGESGQNVLVPRDEIQSMANTGLANLTSEESKRKSLQRYHGIDFNDNFDYMKYMKSENGEDNFGEEEGFLTKSDLYSMQLGTDVSGEAVDPEVAFALEENFLDNPENEDQLDMDDDFVQQLMEQHSSDDEVDQDHTKSDDYSYAMQQFVGQGHAVMKSSSCKKTIPEGEEVSDFDDFSFSDNEMPNFDEEDKKSRFTNYSMSSSVMNRSEGLTRIDDDFETFYENFDEPEMGDLDYQAEEIAVEGVEELDDAATFRLLRIHDKQFQEMKGDIAMDQDDFDRIKNETGGGEIKSDVLNALKAFDDDENVEEKIQAIVDHDRRPQEEFDCESVLTTKSNLFNRPKFVDESDLFLARRKGKITLNKKGLPVDATPSFKKLTQKQQKSESNEVDSIAESQMTTLTVLLKSASTRDKNESPEERKERKKMVKELRRERRIERKNTRTAFQEESILQANAEINRRRDKAIRL